MAKKRHEGEPLLDYAPDQNNVIRYVLEVEPGLGCNCHCPNSDCKNVLLQSIVQSEVRLHTLPMFLENLVRVLICHFCI